MGGGGGGADGGVRWVGGGSGVGRVGEGSWSPGGGGGLGCSVKRGKVFVKDTPPSRLPWSHYLV